MFKEEDIEILSSDDEYDVDQNMNSNNININTLNNIEHNTENNIKNSEKITVLPPEINIISDKILVHELPDNKHDIFEYEIDISNNTNDFIINDTELNTSNKKVQPNKQRFKRSQSQNNCYEHIYYPCNEFNTKFKKRRLSDDFCSLQCIDDKEIYNSLLNYKNYYLPILMCSIGAVITGSAFIKI